MQREDHLYAKVKDLLFDGIPLNKMQLMKGKIYKRIDNKKNGITYEMRTGDDNKQTI